MEENKFASLIKDSLEEEVVNIKMSSSLKENIRKNTMKKRSGFFEKLRRLLNQPIEAPLPAIIAVSVLFLLLMPFFFIVTDNMKKDKAIFGYTSIKIVKIGATDVLIDQTSDMIAGGGNFQ